MAKVDRSKDIVTDEYMRVQMEQMAYKDTDELMETIEMTEFTENRYKIAPSLKLTRVEFYSVNFFFVQKWPKSSELEVGS